MYRIMILDDELNILKSLNRLLRNKGNWELETYDKPNDALRRAHVQTFDLFLSDFKMPELSGVDFLKEVKELQPDSMRLILSGFTDLDALLQSINEAEIYRFICKPWNDFELVETLKQALAYRDVLVENRRLADQVRQQRQELEWNKSVLERLAERHPKLFEVDWAADGSIVIKDEDVGR